MASLTNSLACAGLALILYAAIGLPLAARATPRPLALLFASGLGWAVHSAVALPFFFIAGLSRMTVTAAFAVSVAAALAAVWMDRAKNRDGNSQWPVPGRAVLIALAAAALLALPVMAGVTPKFSPQGVSLAAPIFDHSKIAMIDEMTRLGVPPGNFAYGGPGAPARLVYYYLWHFSAAELSLLAHVSGWEADAGLTWFTAFASLCTAIGLAVWLSGRAMAAPWVVLLAAAASARPVLYALFGDGRVHAVAGEQSGLGAWMFQTMWAPQHMASAMCAVLAIVLLVELALRPRLPVLLIFALTMAAGFESSTWVGGIVFPLAAAPAAIVLLSRIEPRQRLRATLYFAGAGLIALLLIAPFLRDQIGMSQLRGGVPIAITPLRVLDEHVFGAFGAAANPLAYWLIFLVVEFPAIYLTGVIALARMLRDRAQEFERQSLVLSLAILLVVSLCASWLMASTLGENNDLGWRAVLPAVLLLLALAAAGLSRLMLRPKSAAFTGALALIALGVPDAAMLGYGNVVVEPNASSKVFADAPALWQAVRRHAGPRERIANNPDYLNHVTPWGANISWALMANRRSCFATDALVGPLTPLGEARMRKISDQFIRVFDGKGDPDDVAQMASQYHCDVAVVTPQDGAWARDPFAATPYYRLVEESPRWRIYRVAKYAQR